MTTAERESRIVFWKPDMKMEQHMNLEHMVAVVAGGTGGIGSSVARLLAREHAIVVLASRRMTRQGQLVNELRAESPESFSLEADLRSWTGWQKVVKTVHERFQRIDILINCVGVLTPGRFESLSTELIENMITTNFGSFVLGAKAVIPMMKNQRWGRIIHIGSLGGVVPMPHETLYSATKFAVRGLSLSLDKELQGTGIRVGLVSPGAVKTNMLALEADDEHSDLAFFNRPTEPDEVAEAILEDIRNPKSEIMLPRWTSRIGLFLNLFPGGFSFLLPLFKLIGRIRRKQFRGASIDSHFILAQER